MKITDYGNQAISTKTIKRYMFYITRTVEGSPTRAILLHLGGFASQAAAYDAIYSEIEPGIKINRPGMEGCAPMSGAYILRLPAMFHVVKAAAKL